MITVSLVGGIGNQMFQFAAARRLAIKHRTRLCLDTTWYLKGRAMNRPFELGAFALEDVMIATSSSSLVLRARTALHHASRRIGLPAPLLYVEKDTSFSGTVLDLPNGAMLVGYFQSEKYFADVGERIRAELHPKDSARQARVASEVERYRQSGCPLVSIHVRRGDYLSVEADHSLVVSPERILLAMEHFPDAVFLVFSDDLNWCFENLRHERIHMSPFKYAVDDLLGMSVCDHHIIANSSFSWWAAWLDPKPTKMVLAPQSWPINTTTWSSPADLFPEDWLRY